MPAEYKRSTKKKLTMEQLQDITLPVSLELGHKLMRVKELLELTPGRIVKLDRLAGEPVDLVINGKTIAKGRGGRHRREFRRPHRDPAVPGRTPEAALKPRILSILKPR